MTTPTDRRDDITQQEAESLADAEKRLLKRSGADRRACSRCGVHGHRAHQCVCPDSEVVTDRRDEGEAVDDVCELCDGCGEINATTNRDDRDQVGCPACIAREKNDLIATLSRELAEAQGVIERLIEQCAQTAEAWHPMLYAPEHGGSHPTDSAYRSAREGIARAIRALSAAMGTTK